MRTCPGPHWENGTQRHKEKGEKRRGQGWELKWDRPKGRTLSDKRAEPVKGRGREETAREKTRQRLWISPEDQRCERVEAHCNVSTSPILSPSIPAQPPPTHTLQQLFNMEIDLNRSWDIRSGTWGQVPPVGRGEANERWETRAELTRKAESTIRRERRGGN